MSKFQGGMISSVANTPSGTNYTGKANGIWSLSHHIIAKSSSLWSIGQTKPNPPTIGTATATNTSSISVAFIPPVQTGGSTITSYTVTSLPGGLIGTGTSSPIVVSGLTNNQSYTFTVIATNSLGDSLSSNSSNSVQPVPIVSDPYFSSVSVLLSGDSLADSSNSHRTITVTGNAQISTSIKKYGTGSMYFNGASSYISYTDAVGLGSADFTIEFWSYVVNVGGNAGFLSIDGVAGQDNSGLVISASYGIWISMSPNTWTYNGLNPSSAILNTWQHVAIVRSGNTLKSFFDGVLGSSSSISGTIYQKGTTTIIGKKSDSLTDTAVNYIDDLRITKGVARYTANFTPPTTAFPTV